MFQKIIELWPTSKQFYFPNGSVPKPGELVHMPNLAATLREMAAAEKKAHGNRAQKLHAVHDIFYKGDIAHRIANFNEANGGLIAYDDLANFHAELDEPRSTTYRGFTVNKPGFFTQGPVMIEALNILEGYDLKAMGHNSPEYLHTVIEAVKLAFADRDRYYGDPKFSRIPEATLLSKDYAAQRRKQIDPAHASMESRPGELGASAPAAGGGGLLKIATPPASTSSINPAMRSPPRPAAHGCPRSSPATPASLSPSAWRPSSPRQATPMNSPQGNVPASPSAPH